MFGTIERILKSGEVVEIPESRYFLLDPKRGLYRVEWSPEISDDGVKVLYLQRWEGSLHSLGRATERTRQAWIAEGDPIEELALEAQLDHYGALRAILETAEENPEVLING